MRRSLLVVTLPLLSHGLTSHFVQLPAMNFLLDPEEMGPIRPSTFKLIVWALGLCYFGVVFAVPL